MNGIVGQMIVLALAVGPLACDQPDAPGPAPPSEPKIIDITPTEGPPVVRVEKDEAEYSAEDWFEVCVGAMSGMRQDLALAERACGQALELNPQMHGARMNLALLYARAERWSDADAEIETVLEALPEEPHAWRVKGEILATRDRHEEALACWEKAQKYAADPEDLGALFYYNYGTMLQRLGHSDRAVAALRRALSIDETFDRARMQLGALLAVAGKLQDARLQLEAVRKSMGAEPTLWLNLAKIYEQQDKPEARREALEHFIETQPDPDLYLDELKQAYGELGRDLPSMDELRARPR